MGGATQRQTMQRWINGRAFRALRSCSCASLLVAMLGSGAGCDAPPPKASVRSDPRPNLLWVVWDTVRADHLSLYGYSRPTTPHLDHWAKGARVFDEARSAAGYTVPSHASMFTGRLPSEHCANNENPVLASAYSTIAELLRSAGYSTYLYSANPHIAVRSGFAQGFDTAEHPWSESNAGQARRIVETKLRSDRSSELAQRLAAASHGDSQLKAWNLKATGALARPSLLRFLEDSDPKRPWFAFLNYMEAHRPTIPARRFREPFMTPAEVEQSFTVDRSWTTLWEYTFGLRQIDESELALTRATYDAALLELDSLFADLLSDLRRQGWLENTIVVLTSDHGEQLGEHHMLDHQYSLYEPLLRVPLVIHYPEAVAPGRESAPVSTIDLFPTLLALTGTSAPENSASRARSLLSPEPERVRLSEEPALQYVGIRAVQSTHPGWSGTRFLRHLRALVDGRYKFLWSSDGRHELYDLEADAGEADNLLHRREFTSRQLQDTLDAVLADLDSCAELSSEIDAPRPGDRRGSPSGVGSPSEREREMLEVLGYAAPSNGETR